MDIDKEAILFLLNYFKDGRIVLDKPYLISKEAIEAITRLCSIGELPRKKTMKYKNVVELTGIGRDYRALLIDTLSNSTIRYFAYGISYKIYF